MVREYAQENYVKVPNWLIFSDALSLQAKGLLIYILAKPEDWNFCAFRIARECWCGERTVKHTLKELETAWVLVRERQISPGGQMGSFRFFLRSTPSVRFAPVENAPVESAPVRNEPNNKERDTNTEIQIKETGGANKFAWKAKAIKRRNTITAHNQKQLDKIHRHFAEQNREEAEKKAVLEAKKAIADWKVANEEKTAEIEKKHRLRLESERPEMMKRARDIMIIAAMNSEIAKIIKCSK